MRWLSTQDDTVHIRQLEDADAMAELPAPVAEYFAATGFRAALCHASGRRPGTRWCTHLRKQPFRLS